MFRRLYRRAFRPAPPVVTEAPYWTPDHADRITGQVINDIIDRIGNAVANLRWDYVSSQCRGKVYAIEFRWSHGRGPVIRATPADFAPTAERLVTARVW